MGESSARPPTPGPLLAEWLPPNHDPVRPLMTLATVGEDGGPDARSVLLSEWDEQGLYFHTDARSRKTEQLASRTEVALVLAWPEARRQLVVLGIASPAPSDETDRAYAARSPYLQQLAWQNTDAFAALPDDERVAGWSAFREAHATGFAPPETWVGYLVRPTRITFWFGSEATASRRIEYASAPYGRWMVSVRAG